MKHSDFQTLVRHLVKETLDSMSSMMPPSGDSTMSMGQMAGTQDTSLQRRLAADKKKMALKTYQNNRKVFDKQKKAKKIGDQASKEQMRNIEKQLNLQKQNLNKNV